MQVQAQEWAVQFLIARLCQQGIITHHVRTESTATSPQPAFERATDLLGSEVPQKLGVDQACGNVGLNHLGLGGISNLWCAICLLCTASTHTNSIF
jgi:hypothetical protein